MEQEPTHHLLDHLCPDMDSYTDTEKYLKIDIWQIPKNLMTSTNKKRRRIIVVNSVTILHQVSALFHVLFYLEFKEFPLNNWQHSCFYLVSSDQSFSILWKHFINQ